MECQSHFAHSPFLFISVFMFVSLLPEVSSAFVKWMLIQSLYNSMIQNVYRFTIYTTMMSAAEPEQYKTVVKEVNVFKLYLFSLHEVPSLFYDYLHCSCALLCIFTVYSAWHTIETDHNSYGSHFTRQRNDLGLFSNSYVL